MFHVTPEGEKYKKGINWWRAWLGAPCVLLRRLPFVLALSLVEA